MPSLARVRRLARDAGIALAVFALTLGMLAGGEFDDEGDVRALDAPGALLAALASLPLAARRRAPLAVFAVTALASSALMLLGYRPGPPVGATVALYFVAATSEAFRPPIRLTAAVVAALFALHVLAFSLGHDEVPGVELLLGAALWGGAWFAGDRKRLRRERLAELEERARRAEREAERERRLAAAEERTRIARDLHDSAGHAINVILVQAGAARLLQNRDPARTQDALETIEQVARETLDEIEQLVRALRDEAPADDERRVEPPVGLAALESLVERQRTAGLPVRLTVRGERRALTPATDQAAYRILQEALTNAARHGAGSASVEISFERDRLELTVRNGRNDDAGEDRTNGGHGIVGMRERAALLGGTLEVDAGPRAFTVRARLPYSGGRT